MKTKTISFLLPLLFALCSCQSQEPGEEMAKPGRVISVKASLPNQDMSRAVITYGYYDDKSKEVVKWHEQDYITLFNITRFQETHVKSGKDPMVLDIDKTKIDGNNAEFKSPLDYDADFPLHEGDVLFAIMGQAWPGDVTQVSVPTENVIVYFGGSTWTAQKIVENPETNPNALKHVYDMMRMYDIVKVEEEGVVPDLHFKHLSTIMRVTLRNETGKPLFDKISEFTFEYPTGEDCTFIYGFHYFSVAENEAGEHYLMENFKAPEKRHPLNPTPVDTTVTHSYKASHIVNRYLPLVTLGEGETYEFYAVLTPKLGERPVGKELIVNFYDGVESGYGKEGYDCEKYSITIDNFGMPIDPGLRYWFNLTAVCEEQADGTFDRKLMLTSDWLKLHPEQNQGGDETPEN